MIFSKNFDTLDKALTGLWFSLSRSSFFLKIGLTSASFNSSGKHPFSNNTEAVVRRCSMKKVFLEISQNSHLCQSLFFNKGPGAA